MRKLSRILALALVMIIAVSMMTMFAFEASAATINASTKLYLKPNSNWTQANARFAAYFFGNGDEWVSMTDSNGDGIYECTSPNKSYTNVIFCRMNPSSTTNSWDTKWDQTNDLTYDGNKNLYTVAAGAWSKGSGSWSYFCNNNHTWNSGTVTKAATCSATGTMKYTCTKCSTTKTEVIEKTAHSFSGASCTVCGTANPDYCAHSSKTEVNTATCTTAGKHYFDCDNCDEIFDETSVDALGHNYVNGVCSRCDFIITYFVNSAKWENVSAHMWIEGGAGTTWPGNAMTKTGDTVNGFDVYYIESATAYANIIFNNNNAGSQTADLKLAPGQYYNLSDNTWYGSIGDIPEIDHLATGNFLVGSFNGWNTTLNEFKLDKEGGSTSYVSIELKEGETIEFKIMFDGAWYGSNTKFSSTSASGTFSASVTGNTTLTALCKGTYVFALTDKTLEVEFRSHTPGAAADCENAQVCTTCGTQLAAKLGHDMIVDKAVAPTCTATGLTEGSHCSRCDHKVSQTVVDALGHDMIVDKAVAPTCTATGLTEGSHCSRCDHKVAQEVVDALGHDMVTDKAVAPDCLNTGLTEGSHCSRCDHKVAQEVVDALGHDYKAVVTAPTFDAKGYTTHTCDRCGDSYVDSYVDALVAVATVNGERYETLTEAIAVGGEIILLEDVVLEGSLVIPVGKVVTLNLDGHTISQSKECVGSYSMIENKGTLVITGNGKISFTDTSAGDPTFGWGSYTIYNTGTLVVENGTIEHLGEQAFATHMICAIFQYSGSTTINGGVISTPAYRSARLWMGEMVINGGEFDGQLWVQSVDESSKLTINGGTFGPNGRDGSSVFVGNVDNTGVSHAVEFTVTGGSFTTKIGCNDATNLTGKLIVGGSFSESAVVNTNSALVAEGYKFGANGDVVEIVNYEAKIGNVRYETLAEAIAAAKAGDRVVLLDDVSLEATIVLGAGCDVVLDLNGKTITAGFTAEKVEVILAKDGAKLTVTGNGTMIANGNGTYVEVISAIDGANVTIENGTFVSTGCTAIYATRGAVITINGGHYDAQTPYEKDNRYYTLDINEGESNLGVIVVNGGTYVNFDPANHTTDGTALPNMLADGLHTTKSGNVYTVGTHKYDTVVTAPNCENKGYTTHACVCGDSYVTDEVDALGHDMIVDKAVAPTCTATGLTEGSHCSRCDHKVAQTVVDALGHDMIVDKAVAPTCTATGLTEGSHCSRCDHKVAQTVVDALGHDMIVDKAVAPDCLNTGLTEGSHCSRCDHKVAQEVVDALGHDMIVDKAVAPTCTATGLTEGSHCSRCDHKVAQVVVPANGHTEVTIPGTAATCTSTGLTEGKKCSVCYTVLVAQQAIGIKPHTEVEVPSVAPTCTESGLSAGKKCSVCQTVIVPQTTIDALGHTEEIIPGTAATCTSTGLTEGKKCSVCEEILVAQNEIAKLEHTFVNGECACGEQDPHYTNPTTPNPEDEFESDNIIVKILKLILMLFKAFRAFFGSF